MACAETFVIITGGIDLSVGYVMGFSSVTAGKIMQTMYRAGEGTSTGAAIVTAVSVVLVLSLIPGLISGILIARYKVPPFIATLGMWGITNGIALKISEGFPVATLPDVLTRIGNAYVFYTHKTYGVSLFGLPDGIGNELIREFSRIIPVSLVFLVVVVGILRHLLRNTRFGQHTYAIGGSEDAALRSGINVKKHLVLIYVLSSFIAGVAGIFNVFQTGIGNFTSFGAMYELFAVAAVVIGGASLMGGKGTVIGSLIGVFLIAFLENGLLISGVEPFYRFIAVGLLLIVAVVIDQLFPDLFQGSEMTEFQTTKGRSLLLELGRRWALIFLVAEILFFGLTARGFFTLRVFQMILFFGTTVFLLGTAELFVIITGGIDLSVGYLMGFASIVSTKIIFAFTSSGMPDGPALLLGIALTLLIGLIPGLVSGLLVAQLRVPPFIATFAMLGISHGVSELLIQEGAAKNLPHLANAIGNGHFLYWSKGVGLSFFSRPDVARGVKVIEFIPNIVVFAFVAIGILAFVLKRTVFGQHTYAIGGNEDSAVRSGINIKRHLVKIYMLSSFMASVSGIIYMLMYVTGKADAGASSLLDSIAAVVIGGASLSGGRGTVWRTILGGVIIAVLETGMRLMGVPTFDKYIIVGIILISAVLIDQIFPKKPTRRNYEQRIPGRNTGSDQTLRRSGSCRFCGLPCPARRSCRPSRGQRCRKVHPD